MVYTKEQEIVISFTDNKGSHPANFRAFVHGERDVAEVLLMVLTFDDVHVYPGNSGAAVVGDAPSPK
jgi:hypothetical protein